jgi:hypothetical protein
VKKFLIRILLLLASMMPGRAVELALMPQVADYSSMWWAEGFPAVIPDAPWHRCIQTGTYACMLDTETLELLHLGPVPAGTGYAAQVLGQGPDWSPIPAAELDLKICVDGTVYHATKGGAFSRFTGPRLIASGRFVQRADVTDLVFESDDGKALNVEARFETLAWPDQLSLILAARPGEEAIVGGEQSFGRVGGGYGLDGANDLEIAHEPALDPEQFTLALWCFIPTDYQASTRTPPWLVCKNRNEAHDGNYGILIRNEKVDARMNIGGGRDGQFSLESDRSVQLDAWNHLAISYDGAVFRLYLNGALAGEKKIDRPRKPGRHALVFGRREDNNGDGYHFRGVVDEMHLFNRAISLGEIRQLRNQPAAVKLKPVRSWSFRADGQPSSNKLRAPWKTASMELSLGNDKGHLQRSLVCPADTEWHEVALMLNPVTFAAVPEGPPVRVQATEIPTGNERPVVFEPAAGWHRINLDGIVPVVPAGRSKNDAMERIRLVLSNPSDQPAVARLMFEKTTHGIRHRFGAPITGMSAILRDADGQPTGIPVQLSKNWHNHPSGGVYAGQWFHGITQVRLPPGAHETFELSIVYGHWGGAPAASHAQLSLIGWGSNQRWDESALGSWGESICYEPDQVQGRCSILDVRPAMVSALKDGQSWSWTSNVGGGDFFRIFDPAGQRLVHAGMKAGYLRYGPCLTEVTYAGRIGTAIRHHATVSLARTDDLVRGTYRLRMDANAPMDFSRLVLFQIGADTYSSTGERKIAFGNEAGLIKEWATTWGGDTNRTSAMECTGAISWVSLHEAVPRLKEGDEGAWANRGIVIRGWDAILGGKPARPWLVERGIGARGQVSSTIDLVPPPGVTRLETGDYVEATIEHIVMPQFARDYYGPNEGLRAALEKSGNTAAMLLREAQGNVRQVEVTVGRLVHRFPDVRIVAEKDQAEFTLQGGLGYVPITMDGLSSGSGYALEVDGVLVDQHVHGQDFWQGDYDPGSKTWSRTYTVPLEAGASHRVRLRGRQR